MSGADISREACEARNKLLQASPLIFDRDNAALILALRAALDAAERERDEDVGVIAVWRRRTEQAEAERDTAAATHYARGVRDAAEVCEKRLISRSYGSHADAYEYAMNAILALLPEKKTDAE